MPSAFSLSWECSEEASLLKRTMGMGDERLAKVLPLDSSIVVAVGAWVGGHQVPEVILVYGARR